jgi:hypothetical protein
LLHSTAPPTLDDGNRRIKCPSSPRWLRRPCCFLPWPAWSPRLARGGQKVAARNPCASSVDGEPSAGVSSPCALVACWPRGKLHDITLPNPPFRAPPARRPHTASGTCCCPHDRGASYRSREDESQFDGVLLRTRAVVIRRRAGLHPAPSSMRRRPQPLYPWLDSMSVFSMLHEAS